MKPPTFCTLATLCAGACFVASEVLAQQIEELPPRPHYKRICPRPDHFSKEYLEKLQANVQQHWKSQPCTSEIEHLCFYCTVDKFGRIRPASVNNEHPRSIPKDKRQVVADFFSSLPRVDRGTYQPILGIEEVVRTLPDGRKFRQSVFKRGKPIPISESNNAADELLIQFRKFPDVAMREAEPPELSNVQPIQLPAELMP